VNSLSVNTLLQKLAITVTVGSLLFSSPTVAQVLSPAEKARRGSRSPRSQVNRVSDREGLLRSRSSDVSEITKFGAPA